MSDVLRSVELVAECAEDMPRRPATARFPDGQAADDGRLVRAARAGERAAFSALYDRYARIVHGVLMARVARDEVDDLVQDVFLTAWRRLEDLRDPGAFGGWLTMIARNRATDFLRRTPNHVELPEQLPAREASSSEVEAHAALDAIRSLPGAYRETLMLRLVEGLNGPEISARTGLTPASVRVNLHRGMKLLREKLGR